MNNLTKMRINKVILILLIAITCYQFIKISNYKQLIQNNDVEFIYTLDLLSSSIELIEEKKYNDIVNVLVLASAIGQSYSVYKSTSFYNKNELLMHTLNILKQNFSNRSDIDKVLIENDLTILIPVIKKLKDNPLDDNATEEFYYLVRKHTVIGSTLP